MILMMFVWWCVQKLLTRVLNVCPVVCADTPGVHLHHRLPHLLSPEELKKLHPRRRLKPYFAPTPESLSEHQEEDDFKYSSNRLVILSSITHPLLRVCLGSIMHPLLRVCLSNREKKKHGASTLVMIVSYSSNANSLY